MQRPKISLVRSGSKLRPLVVTPKVMSFGVVESRARVNSQAALPTVACVMSSGGSKPGILFFTDTIYGCIGLATSKSVISPI